jgi:hypothetical protein
MSKILTHKDKGKIERIILEHKFKGLGSAEIQKSLLNKLGFKVSRPTIDQYYTNSMNGAVISEELSKATKNAILSVSNDEIQNEAPAYSQEVAQRVFTFVETWKNADNWHERPDTNEAFMALSEVYASSVALLVGNMEAHVNGKERLKTEYVKYVKELKTLMYGNF